MQTRDPLANLEVRRAVAADLAAIRALNQVAFRLSEPGSFEKLLAQNTDALGWVAAVPDGRVLGHIIFTPASIDMPGRKVAGMGLGELAVLPEVQRRGIGSRLTRAGLEALAGAQCPFCIVVGHASYYPRFGFEPGARRGLVCQWPKVPAESFMVAVLDENAMRGVTGTARFRDID
jgi:putative acetyltransferase